MYWHASALLVEYTPVATPPARMAPDAAVTHSVHTRWRTTSELQLTDSTKTKTTQPGELKPITLTDWKRCSPRDSSDLPKRWCGWQVADRARESEGRLAFCAPLDNTRRTRAFVQYCCHVVVSHRCCRFTRSAGRDPNLLQVRVCTRR